MHRLATGRAQLWRRLKIGAVVLVILVGAALVILAAKWPFAREATINSLEQVSASEVRIARFRKSFFPYPGYVAQNVTFSRGASTPPIARISQITCRATWFALITFTHRIDRMDLSGVQVYIPAHIPPPVRRRSEAKIKTTVTKLYANGTVLEIAPRHPGAQMVRFEFRELALENLARNKAIRFRTLMRNPNPPGDMRVSGTVGPLTGGNIAGTRISGAFHFRHADLNTYKVIGGTLSADGRFSGTLDRTQILGRTEIANFEITSSHHSLGVSAEYRALVNGTNGDVAIQSVEAHFLRTTLAARGSITGRQGKTVSLDFEGRQARVEDLLRLFVTADRPPLDGAMTLRAHVVLPPDGQPFLERVQLNGDFRITGAEFTKPATQEKVDELSARARGKKNELKSGNVSEPVRSTLESDVRLHRKIATLTQALFAVPGAIAKGTGTYNLGTGAIDLHGKLAMQATLSRAAKGVKSVLLVPLDPFFKKNGAGAILGARISGTYSHPVFKVSLAR